MAAEKPTHLDNIGLPDTHYNPLQNYRNVSYNTKLTMMPAIESTQEPTKRSYDSSLGLVMWETGGTGDVFLEELTIETTSAGNHTGAYAMPQYHNFEGKLVEPVGGRFIETISVASMTLGYKNNSDAIYLFEISFQGYNTDTDQPEQCKGWDDEELIFRWYVKIKELKMKLDFKGSIYDFSMYPASGVSSLSDHMNLEQGFKIPGRPLDIAEFCKDLETALNKREKAKVDAHERCYPHKYVISAHKEIAGLKFDHGWFGNMAASWSMFRGQAPIPPGSTLQSFISGSLANSKDLLKLLHRVPEKRDYNSTGVKPNTSHLPIKNFCIMGGAVAQAQNGAPLFDELLGGSAMEVHYFITTKEDAKNIIDPREYQDAWDPAQRSKRVNNWIKKGLLRKVYKWIYTGENSEVINANIKIDNLWRNVRPLWIDENGVPISGVATQPAAKAKDKTKDERGIICKEAKMVKPVAQTVKQATELEQLTSEEYLKGRYPHMPQFVHINTSVQQGSQQGAIAKENAQEYSVYRQVGNNQANGGSDMFTMDMEVVGDPYWLFQIPGKPGTAPWEEDVWAYEREQLTEEKLAEKRKKAATHTWFPFIFFEAVSPAAKWKDDDVMDINHSDAVTGIYATKKVVNKFVKGKFTTSLDCYRDQLSNPWNRKVSDTKDEPVRTGTGHTTTPQGTPGVDLMGNPSPFGVGA